jgi:hypothetical protein
MWSNGAEATGLRESGVANTSSLIGDTARPIYLGGSYQGTGNTKQNWEFAFVGTGALTDADLVAITADPSILIEVMAADTTVPTMTGTMTSNSIGATSFTIDWSATTRADNVAVTGYETSPDNSTWTDQGNVTSKNFTGKTASTSYTTYVRAYDAAGNKSTPALSLGVTTLAAATGVTMSGPTSGVTGSPSSNFTLGVTPVGSGISGTLVVTPSDGGAGGTFTPTTKSLTTAAPTGTFTYTAATASAKTISVTNNGSLTNPSNITYTASSASATATVVSGPSSGTVGVASSNFTASANGTITGTVVITPADGGAGGTFSPTTVSISSGSPTATFTYTAASSGAKTISFTNNGALTNQGNLTYTAASGSIVTFAYSAPGKRVMGGVRTGVAPRCTVHDKSTSALLATKTGLTSDGTTGAVSFTLVASGTIVAATEYLLRVISDADDHDTGFLWVTTT